MNRISFLNRGYAFKGLLAVYKLLATIITPIIYMYKMSHVMRKPTKPTTIFAFFYLLFIHFHLIMGTALFFQICKNNFVVVSGAFKDSAI